MGKAHRVRSRRAGSAQRFDLSGMHYRNVFVTPSARRVLAALSLTPRAFLQQTREGLKPRVELDVAALMPGLAPGTISCYWFGEQEAVSVLLVRSARTPRSILLGIPGRCPFHDAAAPELESAERAGSAPRKKRDSARAESPGKKNNRDA